MGYDYLVHHGIKGQKWGTRRYQNKDMSLTPEGRIHYGVGEERKTIKKGDIRRSISGGELNAQRYLYSGRPVYTYDPNNEWDSKVYKGPFAKYNQSRGAAFAAEHEFVALKDINMPSRSERIGEFKNVLNSKKSYVKELQGIQDVLRYYQAGSEKARVVDLNNLKTDSDYEAAYEIFGHAMEASHNFGVTTKYLDNMKSKYAAMIDDNNKDIYNKAQDPIVILQAEAFATTMGPMPLRLIPDSEIEANTNYVREELNKEGIRLKLSAI